MKYFWKADYRLCQYRFSELLYKYYKAIVEIYIEYVSNCPLYKIVFSYYNRLVVSAYLGHRIIIN